MSKDWLEQRYNKITSGAERGMRRLCHIMNQISMKKMAICATILFIASVIPLLVLGKYNVMCIDDYNYGKAVHDVWLQTGSVWQSIQAALRQTGRFFMEWQGTYASCFLMAVCPMNFRYEVAYIVPVLMIGMFATSTFLLGRQIWVRWLGSNQSGACFVMMMLLFMFYQVIEAPYEGIYWYNGSMHYIFMESLLFFLLALVSGCIWATKKRNEILWCALACIDAAIVGGGNLVTGLQAQILLVFLLTFTYASREKRKKTVYVLLPLLVFTAGFLCNILAPGNAVRAGLDTDVGYSAVTSVILSFYHAVVFMVEWTNAFVILLWLALLPIMWRIGKKSEKSFRHPVWVTIGALCILSAMFTPTLFAVGMVGLSRVDSIIQMVYYLCLFGVTQYWLGWGSHSGKVQFGLFLEGTGNVMVLSGVLLVLIVWTFTADKNTYTGISALRSLLNGDAVTYYEEAMERHGQYLDESITDVVIEPFSARPALFDFDDLTENEGNWLNLAVSEYYHKNSVKLRSTEKPREK